MFDLFRKKQFLKQLDYKEEKIRKLEDALRNKEAAFEELSGALRDAKCKNAMLDESPLPKCKGLACIRCKHIVYQSYGGETFIWGCGKDLDCKDYSPANNPEVEKQLFAVFRRQF